MEAVSVTIAECVVALSRLVRLIEDEVGNREGRTGLVGHSTCDECTQGVASHFLAAEPCPYHAAKALIERAVVAP